MKERVKEVLNNLETVAIIGCSENKYRTSYHIANYLKENGIRIIPINPNYDEVLGFPCLDAISDVPEDRTVDVIDIFRDKSYTADMIREVIEWSEKTGQKPLIWTQLDVSSDEAKTLAEENDFEYVENECIMVKHERLT